MRDESSFAEKLAQAQPCQSCRSRRVLNALLCNQASIFVSRPHERENDLCGKLPRPAESGDKGLVGDQVGQHVQCFVCHHHLRLRIPGEASSLILIGQLESSFLQENGEDCSKSKTERSWRRKTIRI